MLFRSPLQLKLVLEMQSAGLLDDLWPCDLVACVAHAAQALSYGYLAFTVVALLKVPGAIERFLLKIQSDGCSPSSMCDGLLAASLDSNVWPLWLKRGHVFMFHACLRVSQADHWHESHSSRAGCWCSGAPATYGSIHGSYSLRKAVQGAG